MSSVEDRFLKVLENYAVASEVKPHATFVEDLGLDSLDTVQLLRDLEEEFGMEIEDTDAERLLTVRDAIDFIKSHLDE